MSHRQTASEPSPWPFSGRGERRPQTARAARTNDPLELPPGVRGQSPEGRRWRDLAAHYSTRLGAERMNREDIRARVRLILWLTVELERLQDQRMCDKPAPLHMLLYMQKELRDLLRSLGLITVVRYSADGKNYVIHR